MAGRDAAVRAVAKNGLRRQRVDDLDVLHLLEVRTDELTVNRPTGADLVRLGRVVLLVSVAQLVAL